MLQDLSKETTKRDRDREIENDRQTDRDIEREICECDLSYRYVTWNVHEPQPGVYDFSQQRNLSLFLQLAQDTNLLVILRAGPYMCGNWDYVSFCGTFLFYDDDSNHNYNKQKFQHALC